MACDLLDLPLDVLGREIFPFLALEAPASAFSLSLTCATFNTLYKPINIETRDPLRFNLYREAVVPHRSALLLADTALDRHDDLFRFLVAEIGLKSFLNYRDIMRVTRDIINSGAEQLLDFFLEFGNRYCLTVDSENREAILQNGSLELTKRYLPRLVETFEIRENKKKALKAVLDGDYDLCRTYFDWVNWKFGNEPLGPTVVELAMARETHSLGFILALKSWLGEMVFRSRLKEIVYSLLTGAKSVAFVQYIESEMKFVNPHFRANSEFPSWCHHGAIDLIKYSIDQPGADLVTGLRLALQSGHLEVVKLLLGSPKVSLYQVQVMHLALFPKNLELIRFLVEAGHPFDLRSDIQPLLTLPSTMRKETIALLVPQSTRENDQFIIQQYLLGYDGDMDFLEFLRLRVGSAPYFPNLQVPSLYRLYVDTLRRADIRFIEWLVKYTDHEGFNAYLRTQGIEYAFAIVCLNAAYEVGSTRLLETFPKYFTPLKRIGRVQLVSQFIRGSKEGNIEFLQKRLSLMRKRKFAFPAFHLHPFFWMGEEANYWKALGAYDFLLNHGIIRLRPQLYYASLINFCNYTSRFHFMEYLKSKGLLWKSYLPNMGRRYYSRSPAIMEGVAWLEKNGPGETKK